MRILIANRGEIARRINRTALALGHTTVAVYADPDRDAPFVREASQAARLGPADLAQSYLSPERILEVASQTAADAVHPGYGFLSERADFASAVTGAGLVWIGPHPEAIARMGSKIEARALAAAAGVPTIPGYDASQAAEDLAAAAERIGYPVLVKAAAGGGGKGIRIVHEPAAFQAALDEAIREAERSFGNSEMIVERYIERARHIEVQIVGDKHGNVVDLGTRECSVQRRYQKLLEEAPAPNLGEEARAGLCATARQLASSIGYDSTGTVEYVVDQATDEFFFLEMNTRLQVEHPVTEAITGLDLVALQLEVASGGALPVAQRDVRFTGHAIEVRINAEDASRGFVPQIGRVTHLAVPSGVRWDSAVEAGSEITPHYDSMIAKLITHGSTRDEALRRLRTALDRLLVGGPTTNGGFQRWLVEQEELVDATVTTRFLEQHPFPAEESTEAVARRAASLWQRALRERSSECERGPWSSLGDFRVTPHAPTPRLALRDARGAVFEIGEVGRDADAPPSLAPEPDAVAFEVDLTTREVVLNVRGQSHSFRVLERSEHWAPSAGDDAADASEATRSPFPAVVTETPVAAGDRVQSGDVVIVIEAMKMLHSLTARGAGTIAEVHANVGDSVASNQVLVSYASDDDENID